MKTTVINNYIDNKIRLAISEKKTVDEILAILEKRMVDTTKSSKMKEAFRGYMNEFTLKRIEDIKFVMENPKLKRVPINRMLHAIKLKDKITGFVVRDIELSPVFD